LIFIQKDIYLDIIADKNKVQDPSGNKVHILDFKKNRTSRCDKSKTKRIERTDGSNFANTCWRKNQKA
jgi:hypothetical protein